MYQNLVDAYRNPDRAAGRQAMQKVITALSRGVPAALTELRTLGSTLKRRASDVLAYFDHPGTSNGPTEAIKCRRRHLNDYADIWVMPTLWACDLVNVWFFTRWSA